jgi:hypothetical protein
VEIQGSVVRWALAGATYWYRQPWVKSTPVGCAGRTGLSVCCDSDLDWASIGRVLFMFDAAGDAGLVGSWWRWM